MSPPGSWPQLTALGSVTALRCLCPLDSFLLLPQGEPHPSPSGCGASSPPGSFRALCRSVLSISDAVKPGSAAPQGAEAAQRAAGARLTAQAAVLGSLPSTPHVPPREPGSSVCVRAGASPRPNARNARQKRHLDLQGASGPREKPNSQFAKKTETPRARTFGLCDGRAGGSGRGLCACSALSSGGFRGF